MPSRAGHKPKQRKLVTTTAKNKLQANQWQNTPMQNAFMKYWLDPGSPSFGNAYRSALAAGYSDNYSLQVASVGPQWLTNYNKIAKMELEHIEQKLIQLINGPINSRSEDDTRVKAIEIYARVVGKLDNKNTTNVTLVQPILNAQSLAKSPETTTETQPQNHTTPPPGNTPIDGELIPD